jgi:copper chaperone NosL
MKFYLAISAAILVSACTAGRESPRDPSWNHDLCSHCRMAISEPRFAAQLIGPGGRVRYYDDLGCALADQDEHPELKAGVLYVHPEGGNLWEPAEKGSYKDKRITPMGYGFGAVRSGGELSLEQVRSKLRSRRAR